MSTHAGQLEGLFWRFPARLGAAVRQGLGRLGALSWFLYQCLWHGLRLRWYQAWVLLDVVRLQIKFTALDALGLTCFAAFLMGGVTLLQVFSQMSAFGAETYLSQLLAKLVIRELGPLMVAIIVIGRSGTAIAAEIASMKLQGEVDTLWATGMNPIQYLLLPRIVAGIVSIFTLIVFFGSVALLGGFFLAWLRLPLLATARARTGGAGPHWPGGSGSPAGPPRRVPRPGPPGPERGGRSGRETPVPRPV